MSMCRVISCAIGRGCFLWPVLIYSNLQMYAGFPVPHHLPEFAQVHVHCIGYAIHSLLFLPLIFPSIKDFSNESSICLRWPKSWIFNFSISLASEYSRLICFKIDWFDLLAVQGILKSLLQYHDWKASVLRCSAFFMTRKKKKLRPREGLGPTQGFIEFPWWLRW